MLPSTDSRKYFSSGFFSSGLPSPPASVLPSPDFGWASGDAAGAAGGMGAGGTAGRVAGGGTACTTGAAGWAEARAGIARASAARRRTVNIAESFPG